MYALLAIFLSIYIFGTLIYNDDKKEKLEKEKEAHKKRCEEQVKLLEPSPEISCEMNDKVLSGGCADEIYEELETELRAVFGPDYKKAFPIMGSEFYNSDVHGMNNDWAQELLYSKKGLCSKPDLAFRLDCGPRATVDIKLCQQIENNLRKHSRLPEITFVQKPKIRATGFNGYDWAIFGARVLPKNMVFPGVPTKRLW